MDNNRRMVDKGDPPKPPAKKPEQDTLPLYTGTRVIPQTLDDKTKPAPGGGVQLEPPVSSGGSGAPNSQNWPRFPNPTERQLRRERMERDTYIHGHPDPKDVAEEEAEEMRYRLRLEAERAKARKQIETEFADPRTEGVNPASVEALKPKDNRPAPKPGEARTNVGRMLEDFTRQAEPPIKPLEIVGLIGVVGIPVCTLLLGAPAAAGVTTVSSARLFLIVAWLIAVIGALLIEWVSRRTWKRVLATTSLTAIFFGVFSLSFYYWIKRTRAEEDARRSQQTTGLPRGAEGFLQWERIEFVEGKSNIVAGREFGANFWSKNPGPTPVYNASGFQAVIIAGIESKEASGQSPQLDDAALEKMVRSSFEDDLRPVRSSYLAGKLKGVTLGVGHGVWGTDYTPPLTKNEVEGILKGYIRLYFLSWFAWADQEGKQHEINDCRWLQVSNIPSMPFKKNSPVWHSCEEH